MKSFTHVSASQISTFQHPGGCNRKWYWNKIVGLPLPQHPSAALGERVHGVAEAVLLGTAGTANAEVMSIITPAMPLLRELAAAKPLVEIKLEHKLRNGLILVGRVDALALNGFRGKEPTVIDHKTSSSEEWALTEEQLQNDLQMNIYAYDALTRLPGREQPWAVRVAHNFMRTRKGAYHRYTDALIPTPTVLLNWQKMQDITDEMKKVALITDPAAVPENRRACDKYGGCHFKDKCQALWATRGEQPANIYANIQSAPEKTMPTATPATVLESMALDPDVIKAAVAKGTAIDDTPTKKYTAGGAAAPAPVVSNGPAINPPEAGTDPRKAKEEVKAITQPTAPAPAAAPNMDDAMKLCIQLGWSQEEVEQDLADDAILFIAGKNVKREDVAELVRGTGVVNGEKVDDVIVEVKVKAKARPSRGAAAQPATFVKSETPAADVLEAQRKAAEETRRADVYKKLLALDWTHDDLADMNTDVRDRFARDGTRRPANDGDIQRADNGIVAVVRREEPKTEQPKTEQPKTQGAAPSRRPRNAAPRLAALGYPADLIEKMSNEDMHRVLDGNVQYGVPLDDPEEAEVPFAPVEPMVKAKDDVTAALEAHLATLEAKLAAESAEVLRLSEALDKESTLVRALRAATERSSGLVLYVDCAPEDGSGVDLDELLAPYCKKAADEGYKDERTGTSSGPLPYYDLMPYNMGQKKVIGYLLSDIAKVQALRSVVVDSRSPMAARALEVLRPLAAAVVAGRGR